MSIGDLLTEVINVAKTLKEFTAAVLTKEDEADARSRHTVPGGEG